jgi:hypothetical protein
VWKLTPLFPLRDRSVLTMARNPSAVDGATIKFLPFSSAVRPPGQDAHNQARMARVLLTPEIKMGVLLGCSPAGMQVLATWPLEWCHLACHSEAQTCHWTCVCWLCWMRLWVQTRPNQWPWAWATHLAEVGRRSRPIQPRTSPFPQETWVAGCWQQLIHPWLMKSQAEARTQCQVLGAYWWARLSRPSLPTHWSCTCPHAGFEGTGRLWAHLLVRCCGSRQTPLSSSATREPSLAPWEGSGKAAT